MRAHLGLWVCPKIGASPKNGVPLVVLKNEPPKGFLYSQNSGTSSRLCCDFKMFYGYFEGATVPPSKKGGSRYPQQKKTPRTSLLPPKKDEPPTSPEGTSRPPHVSGGRNQPVTRGPPWAPSCAPLCGTSWRRTAWSSTAATSEDGFGGYRLNAAD